MTIINKNLIEELKPLREEFDGALDRLIIGSGNGILSHYVASGLRVDAVENLTGAFVGRRRLHGRDDIIVVQVLRTEQIDVRTTLVTLGGAIATIEAITTILTLQSLSLLLSDCLLYTSDAADE